jgi:outer membrane autotransporter protein
LLLSTALASTLLLATLSAPTPARALTNCLTGNPPPGPITTTVADDIICVNVDNRFNAGANVRGRLGLRVGTSMQLWTGTTMEPFVIGSLWGNLSGDDNQATLTSTGTSFILKDDLQDVWGEVSAGVNFFNPSANTSVFAKLDVTFGDDIDGVGGKAGMRVSW